MPDTLVINTGPIISLAEVGALEIVHQLPLRFITTDVVQAEILQGMDQEHHLFQWPEWLEVLSLRQPLQPLVTVNLDAGEASVIQLAIEQSLDTVCIDEIKGRRCAKALGIGHWALGLNVTGSLGLLASAKRMRFIDTVRPWVEAMQSCGTWFHPTLVARLLAELDE